MLALHDTFQRKQNNDIKSVTYKGGNFVIRKGEIEHCKDQKVDGLLITITQTGDME